MASSATAGAGACVVATRATLLVTCDCGSTDHDRLEEARRAGIDAVVIDHHRVPDVPLPAFAFLNPHRPECDFAYKGLASVGLALSIGAGVRAALGVTLDMRRWLDLVAIGTISDVAPLDGDNRALVRAGLGMLEGRTARARRRWPGSRVVSPASLGRTSRSVSRLASTRPAGSTNPTWRSPSCCRPATTTRGSSPSSSRCTRPAGRRSSAASWPRRSRPCPIRRWLRFRASWSPSRAGIPGS